MTETGFNESVVEDAALAWLKAKLEALHKVFAPIVKDLEPATGGAGEDA